MKVLTLRQPWAHLVIRGLLLPDGGRLLKPIENRGWQPKVMPKVLGIHAGLYVPSSYELEEIAICLEKRLHISTAAAFCEWQELCEFGAIIGIVTPGEAVYWSDSPWFEGPKGWPLSNPIPLPEPVFCPGAHGLWDAPLQICKRCGCIDCNCSDCIARTGEPCRWVAPDLCSACQRRIGP